MTEKGEESVMENLIMLLLAVAACAAPGAGEAGTGGCPAMCECFPASTMRCSGPRASPPSHGPWPLVNALNLNSNGLKAIGPLDAFPALTDLIALSNDLHVLDLSDFQGASNIQHIYVHSNRIQAISPAPAGVTFPHLSVISLEKNNITTLEGDVLRGVSGLTSLGLDANPLSRIHIETLMGKFAKNGVLSVSDTPLACKCGYSDIRDWAKANDVQLMASCKDGTPCKFD